MKATVTKKFDGVADGTVLPRTFMPDDIIEGDLAEVALTNRWAKKIRAKRKPNDDDKSGDDGKPNDDDKSGDGGKPNDDDKSGDDGKPNDDDKSGDDDKSSAGEDA